jgi:hypothetical protein
MELRLRLPDEDHARIAAIAKEDETSINNAIVTAISDYVAHRQTAQVRALGRMIAKRDAELLKRLSQ